MKNLKDSQIAFLFSLFGYAITILCLHLAMWQGPMFAKMTIVPFLLVTLVVSAWYTPRVVGAKTKKKAILRAMLAATIIGVLTAMLGFASSVIYHTVTGTPDAIHNLFPEILLYGVVGFIYCLPAILIGGGLAGSFFFKRNRS
jgi:hypothetical protein